MHNLQIGEHDLFQVGPFCVDLKEQTISHESDTVTLQHKTLAVLACLMKNAPRMVSTNVIMKEVWQDHSVNKNSLQRCIAQLRKAFRDNSKVQSIIKTLPKRGYLLKLEPVPISRSKTNTKNNKEKKIIISSILFLAIATALATTKIL